MQSRRFHLALAGALALALAPAVAAQTRDTTRLKEIVVTATRAPTPIGSLGSSADAFRSAELARRQLTSLRDALQLAPGGTVLVTGAPGGVASLFLRGVSSSQTLFLVDGIRVNDANASYGSFLGGADLAGGDRIEVVRGPQSTLWGGAAIGGVVALDAERGEGRARGTVETEGGSFGSWRGRLLAEGERGGLGWNAAFSANGTDNQRRPNGWDQRTQLVRIDDRLSGALRVGGTFRGLQQSYTSPGDLRTTNTTPSGTTTFEDNLGTLYLDATPAAGWRSRLTAGAQEEFTKGTSRFNGGPESVFSLTDTRRVLDWQNTLSLGPAARAVAGVNREWSTVESGGSSQDERLLGVYVEAELSPVHPLTLTAGLRNDDYNSFGHAATYRLTGAWHIERSDTKLRASYGTGFMPPSLDARFGSAFQKPNPDIRPERSRGWDAGVDQGLFAGRGSVSATYFRNTLRDLIGFQGAVFPELGMSVNVDRARTSGLEFSGRLAAGPADARLAYTLLSAVSLSEPDPAMARLIRRPRHTLSADILVAAARRISVGAGVLAVLDREDTDFNTFPARRVDPGDYAVARTYASWDVTRRLTLGVRADNLFDRRYEPVYGFPALGRSVSGSAAVRF
jgi:vitamin B12 transporter